MTSTLDRSPLDSGTAGDSSGALVHAKDAALEKTQEMRSKVGSQISERISEQADQRSTMVGEQVSSIVDALRTTTESLRTEDQDAPAKVIEAVTEQADKFGSYLQETSGDQLLHDLELQARKRPWLTAATLFGIGFAASRVLSASSKERYHSTTGSTTMPSSSLPPTSSLGSAGGGFNGGY